MQSTSVHAHDLATRAIHGGLTPDPTTGAILTPIHQSTTFVQEEVGVDKGYTYSRAANPTVAALERNLGSLEESLPACCAATGMASITGLLLATLRAGDHVVCSRVVYGGTVRILREVLGRFGVEASFVDATDPSAIDAACTPRTRLVIVETPANPTLELCDIAAVADVARSRDALLVVDNTFLTAALQRPLDLGADVTVYSTTKYVEGHNATVGGAIVTRDERLLEHLRHIRKATGFPQSPFEAWLTLRGIKTLPLRLKQHSANALEVARFLEEDSRVARVFFPGLPSHPQHELARRQQADWGGMLAFELHGGLAAGKTLMKSVELCSLAENLGAAETLITHPASMTHGDVPADVRAAGGITDGLVRLSVGLESANDIIEDLQRALGATS